MLLIATEEQATPLFNNNYKNKVAFNLTKGAKGITGEDGKLVVDYANLGFLPDEDTINGIKQGDLSLKRVIKDAKKAIKSPNMDDAGISLGMAQVITMLTSDRKSPVIMTIIKDEKDPERNKILVKYIRAMFKLFGIEVINIEDFYKALKRRKVLKIKKDRTGEREYRFKSRKRFREAIIRMDTSTRGCRLSKRGTELKRLILCFYELELRQTGMQGMRLTDLDRDEVKACLKNLIRTFTATNLQSIDSKKVCKRLAKKDKAAVKAYKELRQILRTIENGYDLPKVKYGQKKKKGKAVGEKMNRKKFIKYFSKKSHRGALILIYGHILARLLEFEVGSKEYNSHMKSVCEPFGGDFAKAYVSAANEFSKAVV